MAYSQYFSYILGGISCVVLWMMGNKNRMALVIGALSQILWVTYSIYLKQYGLIISAILYFIVYIRNYIEWSKPSNINEKSRT
jgi:hypothetical protein